MLYMCVIDVCVCVVCCCVGKGEDGADSAELRVGDDGTTLDDIIV